MYEIGGENFMVWLLHQTPKGMTLAETLCSIALDTMNEEGDSP